MTMDSSSSSFLPLSPDAVRALATDIARRRPVLFLDYDGTLTPIVARPEDARLDPDMRERVRRLATLCPVAVVSGRDLDDVKAMMGLEGLIYAGSHGLDIDAPSGRQRLGEAYRPALERAIDRLRRDLADIDHAYVQPKRYAITVHTRQVDPVKKPAVQAVVKTVLAAEPQLRHMGGKEMHELRPDMDWDKGKAILHLIEAERLDDCYPVFIGDDVTDEDGFRAMAGRGLSIRVAEEPASTVADVILPNIPAVGQLLDDLRARLTR